MCKFSGIRRLDERTATIELTDDLTPDVVETWVGRSYEAPTTVGLRRSMPSERTGPREITVRFAEAVLADAPGIWI